MTDRSFAALRAGFEQAKSAHSEGLTRFAISLAGHTVRIGAVGHALAESVARPLAHLATTSESPGLTVDLWDVSESRVPSPVEDPGFVTSTREGRFLAYERPGSVVVLDRARSHLVGWFDSRSLTQGDRARPLSVPLTVWCGDREVPVIHAGLVAIGGRGALLAGLNRTGKSTAALACACAGFDFLGEDVVALTVSPDGDFKGHSVYNSSLIEPGHLSAFPPLPAGTIDRRAPGDEKSLLLLKGVARAAPIRALALPLIVSSANSRLRTATAGEALRRLAPGSLVKRAVPPQATLTRMARLVDRVPSYWLELDREIDRIAPRVERMLAEADWR